MTQPTLHQKMSCGLAALLFGFAAQMPAKAAALPEDPAQTFRVLCYHDVRDNLRDTLAQSPESTAVDTRELARHFAWLEKNDYHPISVQQIIDARAGRSELPPRAVLLSFDDGYESAYSKVFPLLKQYQFPAMVALVGSWIEGSMPPSVPADARARFVNWSQARDMQQSGLIEIASHSYQLHQGIPANPQGNLMPAATSLAYRSASADYESSAGFARRIASDLDRNASLIEANVGRRPRAMVWPYGAYNLPATEWAAMAGMPLNFTLDSGPNTPQQPLSSIRRELISYTTTVNELSDMLHAPSPTNAVQGNPTRVMQVDLDYVYDPDPTVQEANLSKLLERVVRLHPSTVYLQAFADPAGDGIASAVYFPNRHLPMRADLFARVAWQLRTRAHVNVYAWMPVLAFRLPAGDHEPVQLVSVDAQAPASARHHLHHRLSPFDPRARRIISDLYEDLGQHAAFAGVLFHDDATLSDFEDNSQAAREVYREEWQLPGTIAAIRANPLLRQRWAEHKTAYLNAFTMELVQVLRRYQPGLLTARNLFAEPVLNPAAEEWYAQSLPSFLALYDHVAVMAMPQMEQADDPARWMKRLLTTAKGHPNALNKLIFELQSRDWRSGLPIPTEVMSQQMRQLRLGGVRHLAYYPDDFHHNHPDERILRPEFSNATEPTQR